MACDFSSRIYAIHKGTQWKHKLACGQHWGHPQQMTMLAKDQDCVQFWAYVASLLYFGYKMLHMYDTITKAYILYIVYCRGLCISTRAHWVYSIITLVGFDIANIYISISFIPLPNVE